MQKIEELQLIIKAIGATRTRWLGHIDAKVQEIIQDKPHLDVREAFSRALMNKEVNEEFQNLITLYGMLGSESEVFAKALEPDTSNVVPFPKKAA